MDVTVNARTNFRRHSMTRTAVSPETRQVRWSFAVPYAIAIALVVALGFAAPAARAQDNATITGTVTDASGALVPNASITVTNTATNQSRETVSNTAGAYRFASVGIGNYTLTVVGQGFQKYTKSGI